jgi:hypothetical protein
MAGALPTQKNKIRVISNINGQPVSYLVEDEIQRLQSGDEGKLLVLQRLKWNDGRRELRLAYYMVGRRGRAKGQWVFGQYAAMLPPEDFVALVREARKRGWLKVVQ